MVISNEERAVLLKRLEKAREAKVKKQQEAKDAKVVAPAPAQAQAPAPAPSQVELEPIEEVEDEIALPPKIAPVKAPKKAKKVVVPESSDSDNEDKPVVVKKKALKDKKQPYMKLKLYREPANPAAFQSLLENLNAEYEDEPQPQPQAFVRPPRVLAHSGAKSEVKSKINDARALAMSFFS